LSLGLLILVVFAPLPYWANRAPWVLGRARAAPPMLGCAIAGLRLPWALVNGAVTTGLVMSEAMHERIRNGSEGDYFRVLDDKLEPLGLIGSPTIQLLAASALSLGWVPWVCNPSRGSANSGAPDRRFVVQTPP
jgi:hypothetical protein